MPLPARDPRPFRRPRSSTPLVESLEGRLLLSATPIADQIHPKVHAEVMASTKDTKKPTPLEKPLITPTVNTTAVKSVHPRKSATIAETKVTAKPTPIVVKNKLIDLKGVHGGATTIRKTGGKVKLSQSLSPTAPTGVLTTYYPVAGALSPSQLETAYGVNLLGSTNQGQGETIAIVDELNDTSIISDANAYSAYYNLPQFNTANGPKMTVDLDTDLGSVGSAAGSGVGEETSLDVEMVHAMAPQANILLVEVPASGSVTNEFAQLLEGVQFAAKQPGVVGVSLSYGYPEASIGSSSVVSQNSTYLATGAATNVAITVSTGDGSTPLYPATTPEVIAVGGTSLYLASAQGRYFYETAWGGLAGAGAGGGGPSSNFAAPTFQSANGVTLSSFRTIPDVAMEADDVTPVSVYDSFDTTKRAPSPWFAIGGTSAAAPLFQGVVDLAQQERIANGLPILNSIEIDTAIYEAYNSPAYATFFHDITLGKNANVNSGGTTTVAGYNATTGYDLATGVGSPIANMLVPYLSTYVIGS